MEAAGALARSGLLRAEGVVLGGLRLSRLNALLLLHVVQDVVKKVVLLDCPARAGPGGVALVAESGVLLLLFGLSEDAEARILLVGALAAPGRIVEEISVIVSLRHVGATAQVLEQLIGIIPFIGCLLGPSGSGGSAPGILFLLLAR